MQKITKGLVVVYETRIERGETNGEIMAFNVEVLGILKIEGIGEVGEDEITQLVESEFGTGAEWQMSPSLNSLNRTLGIRNGD